MARRDVRALDGFAHLVDDSSRHRGGTLQADFEGLATGGNGEARTAVTGFARDNPRRTGAGTVSENRPSSSVRTIGVPTAVSGAATRALPTGSPESAATTRPRMVLGACPQTGSAASATRTAAARAFVIAVQTIGVPARPRRDSFYGFTLRT